MQFGLRLITRAGPQTQTIARRSKSTTSFAELFRKSVDSAPVSQGDILKGHVVGAFRPGSTASRFYIADFGLKEEAILTPEELDGSTNIGDALSMPLSELEDDFNEPSFDHSRQSQMSSLQAERYQILTNLSNSELQSEEGAELESARIVYGRFIRFNRGGATVKILGVDAFVPRHHLLALERPVLGAFAPFYLLSMSVNKSETASDSTHLEVYPVVSSYGGILLCLSNLVAFDDVWEGSGGGPQKLRLSYLRLLTRVLLQKNPAVRRMLPANTPSSYNQRQNNFNRQPYQQRQQHQPQQNQMHLQQGMRMRRRSAETTSSSRNMDTAWLNELPKGSWASSGKNTSSSQIFGGKPTPLHEILRRGPRNPPMKRVKGTDEDEGDERK